MTAGKDLSEFSVDPVDWINFKRAFGNSEAVMHKVRNECNGLNKLGSGGTDVAVFSTKVQNCVAALAAVENSRCLHSQELFAEITTNIPLSFMPHFNRYLNRRHRNTLSPFRSAKAPNPFATLHLTTKHGPYSRCKNVEKFSKKNATSDTHYQYCKKPHDNNSNC